MSITSTLIWRCASCVIRGLASLRRACSFVSCRQDLLDIRNFMAANGGGDIDLIDKLEKRQQEMIRETRDSIPPPPLEVSHVVSS